MLFLLDRKTDRLVPSRGAKPIAALDAFSQSVIRIQLGFIDGLGTLRLPGTTPVIRLGASTEDGDIVAMNTLWVLNPNTNIYEGYLNLNTEEAASAIGDLSEIPLLLQLVYKFGEEGPFHSQNIKVDLYRSAIDIDDLSPVQLENSEDWLDARAFRIDKIQDLDDTQKTNALINLESIGFVGEPGPPPSNAQLAAFLNANPQLFIISPRKTTAATHNSADPAWLPEELWVATDDGYRLGIGPNKNNKYAFQGEVAQPIYSNVAPQSTASDLSSSESGLIRQDDSFVYGSYGTIGVGEYNGRQALSDYATDGEDGFSFTVQWNGDQWELIINGILAGKNPTGGSFDDSYFAPTHMNIDPDSGFSQYASVFFGWSNQADWVGTFGLPGQTLIHQDDIYYQTSKETDRNDSPGIRKFTWIRIRTGTEAILGQSAPISTGGIVEVTGAIAPGNYERNATLVGGKPTYKNATHWIYFASARWRIGLLDDESSNLVQQSSINPNSPAPTQGAWPSGTTVINGPVTVGAPGRDYIFGRAVWKQVSQLANTYDWLKISNE